MKMLNATVVGVALAGALGAQDPRTTLTVDRGGGTVNVAVDVEVQPWQRPLVWCTILLGEQPLESLHPALPPVLGQATVLAAGAMDGHGFQARIPVAGPLPEDRWLQPLVLDDAGVVVAGAPVALETGNDTEEAEQIARWLEQIECRLHVAESVPPQYSFSARFEAISDGFALDLIDRRRTPDGTVIRLYLKVPGEGEGMLDIARTLTVGTHLGTDPGRVRVLAAAGPTATSDPSAGSFVQIAELDPDPATSPLERIELSLHKTDSVPPHYSLKALFEADSDGYELIAGDVDRTAEGTVVHLVLDLPGQGEGYLDIMQVLQAGAHLGPNPGERVFVLGSTLRDGVTVEPERPIAELVIE